MSQWLAERTSALLASRTSRRGFLVRSAVVGSALAVAPVGYVLRPLSAYAAVCACGDPGCGCGSACCDGYTEFCCTLYGANACPPGTFAGGWWKSDGSAYCAGARYYIDCMGECTSCRGGCANGGSFCDPGCDNLECGCGLGSCDQRQAGCVTFRYGQCHQEIACSGRIACRAVTCIPPWQLDSTCTTTVLVDEATADQNAPCLEEPVPVGQPYVLAARPGGGVWLASPSGGVFSEEGAPFYGAIGSHGRVALSRPIAGVAATPTGKGYWLVAADGGIFTFGDAGFHGSTGDIVLSRPIVGMAATPTGKGYWLVASDGGIFTFGDAGFHGSTGGLNLAEPIGAVLPTPSGQGYWLLGLDGGVFTFGDAPYLGSYTGLPPVRRTLPAGQLDPFVGMTANVQPKAQGGQAPPAPPAAQAPPAAEAPPAGRVVSYTLYAVLAAAAPPTLVALTFPSSATPPA
ncbi:MAG: twin-arginine translocation signal domain-containing protein [Acidimicrobiales bacterium]